MPGKLFGKKDTGKLKPDFEYKVDGILWRIQLSPAGHIICEVRDPQKKTAWFDCIDEATGGPLWQNRTFDEPWWIGIEEATDTRLYLHRFRKPDMPEHAGVIAVSLADGSTEWEAENLAFMAALEGKVYVSQQRFESRVHYELDPDTGKMVKELGTDASGILRAKDEATAALFADYRYPGPVADSSGISNILASHTGEDAVAGAIDVLELDGILLASWHRQNAGTGASGPSLDQVLIAIELESNSVIYTDTLNSSVSAPSLDSFFLKGNRIMYVKEQHVLVSLSLLDE